MEPSSEQDCASSGMALVSPTWVLSRSYNRHVRTHRKLTTLEWKLHGFFRAIYYEIKAPHFCSKFDQSSAENDFTRFELHGNGQNSHDFSFHRKTR